jgi:hypothetical protein
LLLYSLFKNSFKIIMLSRKYKQIGIR